MVGLSRAIRGHAGALVHRPESSTNSLNAVALASPRVHAHSLAGEPIAHQLGIAIRRSQPLIARTGFQVLLLQANGLRLPLVIGVADLKRKIDTNSDRATI